MKKNIIIIADYSEQSQFKLEEICDICQSSPDFIQDLIEYEIILPIGNEQDEWLFDIHHLQRIQMVLRLQHDLEVNIAGAALVLDLLDELEELRTKAELLEKHLLK